VGVAGDSNFLREGAEMLRSVPIFRRDDDKRYDGEANREVTETGAGSPDESPHPILDTIWSWPTIYADPDHPFFQEFSFFGRYQGQSYLVDSSQGDADGWETRRLRLGARAVFLRDFTLAGNVNLPTEEDSGNKIDNDQIDTLTIAWDPNDDFQLVIGQQKPGFSYEYDTSSNRILTFERSLLVNQTAPSKSPGVAVEAKSGKVSYQLGGYSGKELGSDFGDSLALAKVGYDFSELTRFEKTGLQLYYLHNSERENDGAAPYRNSFSASMDFQEGPGAIGE
jgi:hypothetical protein